MNEKLKSPEIARSKGFEETKAILQRFLKSGDVKKVSMETPGICFFYTAFEFEGGEIHPILFVGVGQKMAPKWKKWMLPYKETKQLAAGRCAIVGKTLKLELALGKGNLLPDSNILEIQKTLLKPAIDKIVFVDTLEAPGDVGAIQEAKDRVKALLEYGLDDAIDEITEAIKIGREIYEKLQPYHGKLGDKFTGSPLELSPEIRRVDKTTIDDFESAQSDIQATDPFTFSSEAKALIVGINKILEGKMSGPKADNLGDLIGTFGGIIGDIDGIIPVMLAILNEWSGKISIVKESEFPSVPKSQSARLLSGFDKVNNLIKPIAESIRKSP